MDKTDVNFCTGIGCWCCHITFQFFCHSEGYKPIDPGYGQPPPSGEIPFHNEPVVTGRTGPPIQQVSNQHALMTRTVSKGPYYNARILIKDLMLYIIAHILLHIQKYSIVCFVLQLTSCVV